MIRSIHALRRATALVCLPLACAGLLACGGSEGGADGALVDVGANAQPAPPCEAQRTCASTTPSYGTTGSATGAAGSAGGTTDAGATPTTPTTPTPPAADGGTTSSPVDATLSDGQIFAILLAANGGEIAEGRLAHLKSPRSAVRDLADAIVMDHDEARKAEIDLAWRLHVLPLASDVSRALEQETAEALLRLTPMDGETFDPTYVGGQVTAHENTLSIIDTKLLPSVESATLRAHIVDVRAKVQAHLARAVALRATLP